MSFSPRAFAYQVRRDGNARTSAYPGTTIAVRERVEYVLDFDDAPSQADRSRLLDLGAEFLKPGLAVVSFGNFVGQTSFAGVRIDVLSSKIGPGGVSRILQEVSALSAALVFGWRSSADFMSEPVNARLLPVPYHQLQLLRHIMIGTPTGQRLQDWLHVIERSPTRRFAPKRVIASVDRVRRIDQRALQLIFSRLDSLVPLQDDVQIVESRLAQRLTFGTPPQRHFPVRVDSPHGQLSFDTPENRFIRHVIAQCLGIIYRFIDHPQLHSGLRADCRMMLALLEPVASATFVVDAISLLSFRAPTHALAKMDGYREVFQFWNNFTSYVALPRGGAETTRLLEGRDMATLYEYWTFLKILECVCTITGREPGERPLINRDELGERLRLGIVNPLGSDLEIWFNMTFRRDNGTAYSTPLRRT